MDDPRYPEIQPHDRGMLDVGDGHKIYWEVCGNPTGKPALVLHGGPGSGCTTEVRRIFDPSAYRIVLFDQRSCGRSTPHASDPRTNLSTNTTEHLLSDIEHLRVHLAIEQWLVFGGSWGSTLGIAYAERQPQRVSELILSHVTTTTPSNIDWLYHGVGKLFPEDWTNFRSGAKVTDPNNNLVEAYYRLLQDPAPAIREKAAQDWCNWECAVISINPDSEAPERYADPAFRMCFARIVTHYFHHNAWLEDGVLLHNAHLLNGIPGIMIHGRLDLGTPLATAWELAQTWQDSRLVIVEGAGHESRTPGMLESIITATDKFAQ